jgi:hypothetical protein
MAYSKNFPEAKSLREKFQRVSSIAEVEEIGRGHLARHNGLDVQVMAPAA